MKMTPANLRKFKEEFLEALSTVEKKYGVSVSVGKITYSEDTFTTKITVSNGSADEVERREFEKYVEYYSRYGLTKAHYGKKFTVGGKAYALVGFKPRATKNQFVIRSNDGKTYTCSSFYLGLKQTV